MASCPRPCPPSVWFPPAQLTITSATASESLTGGILQETASEQLSSWDRGLWSGQPWVPGLGDPQGALV